MATFSKFHKFEPLRVACESWTSSGRLIHFVQRAVHLNDSWFKSKIFQALTVQIGSDAYLKLRYNLSRSASSHENWFHLKIKINEIYCTHDLIFTAKMMLFSEFHYPNVSSQTSFYMRSHMETFLIINWVLWNLLNRTIFMSNMKKHV